MFWLEPGLPTTMRGGVRPRTTLSPSMVTRDGAPWLAFGTPGGDQQDQWQLSYLLAVLHTAARPAGRDRRADVLTPSTSPARSTRARPPPARVVVEGRLPAEVVAGLRERGHTVRVGGDWSQGRLSAAGRDATTGLLRAAANPRGMQGYAVGR